VRAFGAHASPPLKPRARDDPGLDASWHALDVEEVRERLGTSREGLSRDEAAQRRARFGPNALPQKRRRPAIWFFLRQFASPLIYLLLFAAAIAVAVGEARDAAVIVGVLLLNAVVGGFQEGRAERSMIALRRMATLRTTVLRDGEEQLLQASELVPGDLVRVAAGDAVPADLRLVGGVNLQLAEAALTGESSPVAKQPAAVALETPLAERRDMLFAGAHVASGRGWGWVVAAGPRTEVGRLALLAESAGDEPTPLERRLAGFGRFLAFGALIVFAFVLAGGLARGLGWDTILMVAISQLVSTVPEGLPVVMTVALAVGMRRMAERRAIVRRLVAVESLGSTTVICTDKTGTLTRNEMTVTVVALPDGRRIDVTGAGYAPVGALLDGGAPRHASDDPALRALLEAAVLCNDASLVRPPLGSRSWAVRGDPTEAALLSLARPMLWRILLLAVTIAGVTLGLFGWRVARGASLAETRTVAFTLLAVCEWFNVINCRSAARSAFGMSLLRNRWLLGGLVLSNLLQIAVVYVPPLQRTFHTVPLSGGDALLVAALGSLVLWIEEARKLHARRRAQKGSASSGARGGAEPGRRALRSSTPTPRSGAVDRDPSSRAIAAAAEIPSPNSAGMGLRTLPPAARSCPR
jgi:magnesium-transporting ATPase (P-type)